MCYNCHMQDNGETNNSFAGADQSATPNQALPPTPTNQTTGSTEARQLPQIEPVAWTASESITEKRSGRWYGIATAIFIVVIAVTILLFVFNVIDLMALVSSIVLVVAMFIALIISTRLPSRELSYVLSGEGISINGQNHPFSEFRAFGVRQQGGLWQLVLIPVRRFGLEVVTYIDEQHGERIVDILAGFLPMEEVPENGVDKLINRLKI